MWLTVTYGGGGLCWVNQFNPFNWVLVAVQSQFWRLFKVIEINDEILKGEKSKYITVCKSIPLKNIIENL